MAKRNNQRIVKSDAVQGEGSFVTVSPLTYGEQREVILNPLEGEEYIRRNERNVRAHIHAWDWVDGEGAPLPLPNADETVFMRLTVEEFNFLVRCINGEDPNAASG